jgi:hypothetical protein
MPKTGDPRRPAGVVAVEQTGAGWGLDMCLQLGPRTKMNHQSDRDKPIPTLCSTHSLDCSKIKKWKQENEILLLPHLILLEFSNFSTARMFHLKFCGHSPGVQH